MSHNKIKTLQSLKSVLSEEPDNPETAFSKLMAIPSDKEATYECRMLFESMKE